MKKLISLMLSLLLFTGIKADEGMWMLPLIEQLNIRKMQGMGCTLTAEEIYSEQSINLKDAVIVFGGGCTGVVVSNQGLIFTNHHCGYGAIQELSSIKHNYLRDGFTAKELSDEIPAPGLTVKFLVGITDVTDRIMSVLQKTDDYRVIRQKQDSVIRVIKKEFNKDNDYLVDVESFYSKNEFYVFVMEEFKDVRLAFTPPSSIGKFGGDTDNWMWPRHTGDFSVFRVYADSTGKPAEYAATNIPYTPKKVISVSTKGYKEGDFAMILGNPGSTSRYITSYGLYNRIEATNLSRIDVRGEKQAVWRSYMKENEAINIAYAGKYARSSNYWKNSIGMNKAVQKLGIMERKKTAELDFAKWVNESPERVAKYGQVLPTLERNYKAIFPTLHAMSYLREALLTGVEMPRIAGEMERLIMKKLTPDSILKKAKDRYDDYYAEVDAATFAVMLETYRKHVNSRFLPTIYLDIDKKFKGDYTRYAEYVFKKSAFTDYEKFSKRLQLKKINLKNDPALVFLHAVEHMLNSLDNKSYTASRDSIQLATQLLEAGLKEINFSKGTKRYPDANFTMRMTYGSIGGYEPADAVTYNYYTTTKGILEKEIPGDMEFDVPAKLKEAINKRDFGSYADPETGELFVNFLSNNDITGGNSGSPIFNAKGELLGLAFDGNWEAMSGDIVFEPELQRTINVDVRYMLFIMDKIGEADRLLQEITIN
ncbi:MAG: S46 family peptidase [Paludibacter sp.]|nr:S46 family peptidase [Paludibacter sp.]MDD4428029.1 S46 family peptidase [Paludibacter sp.]